MKIKTERNPNMRIWIGLMLAVSIFLSIGAMLSGEQAKLYPDFVSNSPSPTGTKGFYTFLKGEFDHVDLWAEQFNTPTSAQDQLMMMVQPSQVFAKEETEQWVKWMEAGYTIWLMSYDPNTSFDVDATLPDGQIHYATGEVFDKHLLSSFEATIPENIRLKPKSSDEVLLRDKAGVLALSRAYGKGKLVVSVTPEWLTNDAILEADHLPALLSILERINPKRIWFNEAIHGYEGGPALFNLYPHWLLLLFFQGTLLLLLWLWKKGKRFGPIDMPRAWTVRFGDEQIRTLAAWYERGKFYKESLHNQEQYLRYVIQERYGIPANIEGAKMLSLVKRRLPEKKQENWESMWRAHTEVTQSKNVNHKLYLKGSKQIDQMRKEVENE
jgi:hypothetical protein